MFKEIEKCYNGENSIFDKIKKNDLIFAFFPCTRFEAQILLHFRGDAYQYEKYSMQKKLENDIRLHKELNKNYEVITKLVLICLQKSIKLIIENPYAEQHYLNRYWCLKSNLIIKDRSKLGYFYKKPTQFWFLNCVPKNNEIDGIKEGKIIGTMKDIRNTVKRSLISSEFADNFVRKYVL